MATAAEIQKITSNYDIDYNDSRFGKVESDKEQALTDLEKTYAGMIGETSQFYDDQIQASKDWADKQAQLQQDRTDFTIEQIEQQKDKANKDYLKEQSASFVDWQKQSNKYGVNAEQMASAGLTNTGYSESSQVSMYNTYQNRVATAREVYNQAVLNYNNSIKDAQLQNNAALAEIAYNALQKQLELSLQGFQYKNQLILEQANKKTELENIYYSRYQDVLAQINRENELKEDIRQYQETMEWNTEQAEINRQHEQQMAAAERQFKAQQAALDRQFEKAQADANRQFQSQQAALERQHDKDMLAAETKAQKERLQQQYEMEMAQLEREQQYKLQQMDKQYANEKALLNQQLYQEQQYKLQQLDKQLANEKALLAYESSIEQKSNKSAGIVNKGSKPGLDLKKTTDNGGSYTPSASVKSKINSLASMRGQTGSKKAIANSICVYYAQGQITEKDCEYMLRYFGYDPDDYLE